MTIAGRHLPELDCQPEQALTLRMTEEEFDAWVGEVNAEFAAGEAYVMAPVSGEHSDIQSWLMMVLRGFVRRNKLGTVRGPEFQMRFQGKRFEPDVLFVKAAHGGRLKTAHLEGPADMVMEIVSPESVERDTEFKREQYEREGVAEYWIIDSAEQRVELLALRQGKYERIAERDGRLWSAQMEGFWLRPEWLWEMPDELDVLKELGVGA